MMDTEVFPPPLRERVRGKKIVQTIHLIPLGMERDETGLLKKAGIQQQQENIFEKLF